MRLFNERGNSRFYQWDIGQQIIIEDSGITNTEGVQVHFSMPCDNEKNNAFRHALSAGWCAICKNS